MSPVLDRFAAFIGRASGMHGAIICLHGLDTGTRRSSSSMHITLAHLSAIVEHVRRAGRLVSLKTLVEQHLSGQATNGLVALTADDSYASWLEAEPLIRRVEIPLTMFPVSDALTTGQRFWWDRIDDAAAAADTARWRQLEDECGLPAEYRRNDVQRPSSRPLRQWLLAVNAGRMPEAVEQALSRVESDLEIVSTQRSMTASEFSGFLERTEATVGVHTASHAALPFLSDKQVVREVHEGHTALKARFPRVLPYLAIPFGLFDERTSRLAAEAGMSASFTLEAQPLRVPTASTVGIPRVCVVREQGVGMLMLRTSRAGALIERARSGPPRTYPILPGSAS